MTLTPGTDTFCTLAEAEANPGGVRRILLGRYLDLPQRVRKAWQASPASSTQEQCP